MIKIVHLTKRFRETIAVDDLNLEIPKGELFCFIGPNGAGKTTTIKLLTGLLFPTSGEIFIGGYNVQTEPLKAKSLIGYIPDSPFLYEKLTGEEFLSFIAGLYGMKEADGKIEEFLGLFGLSDYKERLISDYSHGMRQRLAFSAILLHHPEVIVIDEPLVGLDPASSRLVKDLLRKETAKGKTIFLSTHTLSVAEEIADRIGVIHKGKLIVLGKLEDLRKKAHSLGKLEEVFLQLTQE
ncbi:MAG: ABC transporter ATP-binding protein [Candidatus Omnitrophica bacterium]|nr:ABC transporter ATP-binding protein [Candidatus Omnitrophota bacterium]